MCAQNGLTWQVIPMYKCLHSDKLYPNLKILVLAMTVNWLQPWPPWTARSPSDPPSAGLQFQISCCTSKAISRFLWAWTGQWHFQVGLASCTRPRSMQRVVNGRNTGLRGKVCPSSFLATSWFLSNKWCSRRQSCINTCWVATITWWGSALALITWSRYPGTHIKAEHAWHLFVPPFFFGFAFYATHK